MLQDDWFPDAKSRRYCRSVEAAVINATDCQRVFIKYRAVFKNLNSIFCYGKAVFVLRLELDLGSNGRFSGIADAPEIHTIGFERCGEL
jgi:hypothetical protein